MKQCEFQICYAALDNGVGWGGKGKEAVLADGFGSGACMDAAGEGECSTNAGQGEGACPPHAGFGAGSLGRGRPRREALRFNSWWRSLHFSS
jgi:hypothetical protein